jgi:hypothetical protein
MNCPRRTQVEFVFLHPQRKPPFNNILIDLSEEPDESESEFAEPTS